MSPSGYGEGRERCVPGVLEELAFGCAGISHDAHVDITMEMSTLHGCHGNTSKQHLQNTMLHLIITWGYTGVYWRYTGGIHKVYWRYAGGILGVYWRYTGGILAVYCGYTGGILEVYWRYTEVILTMDGREEAADEVLVEVRS